MVYALKYLWVDDITEVHQAFVVFTTGAVPFAGKLHVARYVGDKVTNAIDDEISATTICLAFKAKFRLGVAIKR